MLSSALVKLGDPEAKSRAEAVLERLKQGPQGYSRFFELREIDEGVFEPVYIRDLALVETAKRLKEAEDAGQLAELLLAFESALDDRNRVLREISEALLAVLRPSRRRDSFLWRMLKG